MLHKRSINSTGRRANNCRDKRKKPAHFAINAPCTDFKFFMITAHPPIRGGSRGGVFHWRSYRVRAHQTGVQRVRAACQRRPVP